MTTIDNKIEKTLFDMLVIVSSPNKILEAKEFLKWSNENYFETDIWFSRFNDGEQEYLEQQELITNDIEEKAGIFGKITTTTIYNIIPKLREDAIQLK